MPQKKQEEGQKEKKGLILKKQNFLFDKYLLLDTIAECK